MAEERLDFLDSETPETDAADEVVNDQPEAPEQAAEEPQAEAATDDQSEEGTGEQEAEPPAAKEQDQRFIPVTALLDERERRQEATRKAEELERQLQAMRQEQEKARVASMQRPPSFKDNPDQALQARLEAVTLQQSRFLAEREYGQELVAETFEFFEKNPKLSHQFRGHPSPFHAAVEFYKRQKVLQDMGDDPEAYIQQQVEARLASMQQPQSQPSSKSPPPSMTKATSAGRESITPGSAFDGLFDG